MAKQKQEAKIILEREYIVPLRKKFLKTPKYRRTPKAVKSLKMFIAKHMKVPERDLKKVKIEKTLNAELWFRGIKNPPGKIKVKVKKYDDNIVRVELSEMSERIKWMAEKEKKIKQALKEKEKKKIEKPKEEVPAEGEKPEEKEEKKEKQEAVKESAIKEAEKKAKQHKHETAQKAKKAAPVRKALKK